MTIMTCLFTKLSMSCFHRNVAADFVRAKGKYKIRKRIMQTNWRFLHCVFCRLCLIFRIRANITMYHCSSVPSHTQLTVEANTSKRNESGHAEIYMYGKCLNPENDGLQGKKLSVFKCFGHTSFDTIVCFYQGIQRVILLLVGCVLFWGLAHFCFAAQSDRSFSVTC